MVRLFDLQSKQEMQTWSTRTAYDAGIKSIDNYWIFRPYFFPDGNRLLLTIKDNAAIINLAPLRQPMPLELAALRRNMTAQVQQAYQPFLALIQDLIPNPEIIVPYIKELYHRQQIDMIDLLRPWLPTKTTQLTTFNDDIELLQRSSDGLIKLTQLDFSTLPISLFQQKMRIFLLDLPTPLHELQRWIQQEDETWQKDCYRQLFSELMAVAVNSALGWPSWSKEALLALGLGYPLQRVEQSQALPRVAELIIHLQTLGAEISTLSHIIYFIGQCSRISEEQHEIMIQQLTRLLEHPSRNILLKRMIMGFAKTSWRALDNYLQNRHVPAKQTLGGEARAFAVFFTYSVHSVKVLSRQPLPGKKMLLPKEGIYPSQMIILDENRPKQPGEAYSILSLEELLAQNGSLPSPLLSIDNDIVRSITLQSEAGAYTIQAAQNARDATQGQPDGRLTIKIYIEEDEEDHEEATYVESIQDSGPGASYPMALVLPKSTKQQDKQVSNAGFYGTGKYTFAADRIEIINCHQGRAVQFSWVVDYNQADEVTSIRLIEIILLDAKSLPTGVTIRRMMSLKRVIPELEQMLAEHAWQTFTSLSQHKHFHIDWIDENDRIKPLPYPKVMATSIGLDPLTQTETPFSIVAATGVGLPIPSQLIDRAGLRIGPIPDEFLTAIPQTLRRHLFENNLHLLIGLPVIRNRGSFEYQMEKLAFIQKYTAIIFYRTLTSLMLKPLGLPLAVYGFPRDWLSNSDYAVEGLEDQWIEALALKINQDQLSDICLKELERLAASQSRFPDYVKLLVRIVIPPYESLLQQRQKVLSASREKEMIPDEPGSLDSIPHGLDPIRAAKSFALAGEEMKTPESCVLAEASYTPQHLLLVNLALFITKPLGLQQVKLVTKTHYTGFFSYKNEADSIFYVAEDLADQIAQPNEYFGHIDTSVYLLGHEGVHFIEIKKGDEDDGEENNHEANGFFGEGMRYFFSSILYHFNNPNMKLPYADLDDSLTRRLMPSNGSIHKNSPLVDNSLLTEKKRHSRVCRQLTPSPSCHGLSA